MPRVRKGAATRQARKRVMKAVSGHRGGPGHTYRLAKEALGPGTGKRTHRPQETQTRIPRAVDHTFERCGEGTGRCVTANSSTAARKQKSRINRKMLSEIAIADPAGFDKIVEAAKAALA